MSAFNPLAAQGCVLCRQGFSSSVCQTPAGVTWAFTTKVYQQCWKVWASLCFWEGVWNNALKLADDLVCLFRIGLARCTIGIYHFATICWVLGKAMTQQPNICKVAQSSLYSWTMYIIKETRYCHLMLNSPATRWHLGFHFLFLNSAILHSCILVSVVYIYWYLPFILDTHQLFLLICVVLYL